MYPHIIHMHRKITPKSILAFISYVFSVLLVVPDAVTEEVRAVPLADLQLFGDVYLPKHILRVTSSSADQPRLLDGVADLLNSGLHNVINLEGAVTAAADTPVSKQFLLKMPVASTQLLQRAGITAATLANNHSMDFGPIGLEDTLRALRQAGIARAGAGPNDAHALRPLLLDTPSGRVCILALSRTLPEAFWATPQSAGTAHASVPRMQRHIAACRSRGYFTMVAMHWGVEMSYEPATYQRSLARAAVAAGAQLVFGHHPHVLQDIEIINGVPVFYSLGNFAFGSLPAGRSPEGMALRVYLPRTAHGALHVELVPLQVRNDVVSFRVRPLAAWESDPIAPRLPSGAPCFWSKLDFRWRCRF